MTEPKPVHCPYITVTKGVEDNCSKYKYGNPAVESIEILEIPVKTDKITKDTKTHIDVKNVGLFKDRKSKTPFSLIKVELF